MMIFTPNEQRQQARIHALQQECDRWRLLALLTVTALAVLLLYVSTR